ncbi:MAG: copper resistance protein CopC [Bradyrhizobium sp.]|uniref:copper resistance CopC family protein n=1 Tax=Bradyrhizobium TaxID=374 RepID=UPI00048838AE|nr:MULTISPECIES: copper resistance CopC family protein [Bradyrhizobium]MBJ7403811.1 copper resistance protein CopC [Bradyrhizobium sp.]
MSLLLAFALLLLYSQRAFSHAIVIQSSPAVDASVAAGDVAIRLRFNSRIDHARSKLRLYTADGKEIILKTDPDLPHSLEADARILAIGAWHLRWQVLSVDGHITRGDIPFSVR